jgi:divalent metal cation (Fe/Co/Zn/Cd) transporter
VKDYHKKIDIVILRANIMKDIEAIMARFLCGWNKKITNVIELQYHVKLEDMIHMANKIERRLKRNESTCKGGNLDSFSS